jgi:hypothetical protein
MPEYITANLVPLSSVRHSSDLDVSIDEENNLVVETKSLNQFLETSPEEISFPVIWDKISFLTLEIRLASGEGKGHLRIIGAKRSLSFDWQIDSETKQLTFPLTELPLVTEAHDAFRVKSIELKIDTIGAFYFKNIRIAAENSLRKEILIDEFGQRVNSEWDNKILEKDNFEDRKQLDATTPLPPHSIGDFGGWKGDIKFSGSGYFKLGKTSSGRWWLIDPDGHPFWSFGVGQIGLDIHAYETLYNGREYFFAKEISSHAEGLKINHYKVNSLQKYGSKDTWLKKQKDRLKHWGLNTVGAHSESLLFQNETIPVIVSLPTFSNDNICTTDNWPDIFCHNWQEWFQETVPEILMQWNNQPNLLAYQIGRNLPWSNSRILDSESDSAIKSAWRDFMSEKYSDISEFNGVWESSYTDWDALLNMSELNIPKERNKAEKDKEAFLIHYAEKYFSLLSNIVTSLDEQHLLLGPCFGPELPPDEILKLAGQHFDIICWVAGSQPLDEDTVNKVYSLTERPILITGGAKEKNAASHLVANTADHQPNELAAQYRKDIELALKLPYVLGYHFDSLVDDPISGRIIDDERRNAGLVDITDTPYTSLTDIIRLISTDIYKERLKAN